MKKSVIFVIAIFCGVAWWVWMDHPPKPRMFKSETYPPKTTEEQAMWEWWRAMQRTDPNFEWKTPIAFYGKAIDQFGKPVSGAKVEFMLSVIDGTTTYEKITADDGRFELSNAKGKGVSVSIDKEGYASIPGKARKSFEYAAFYQADFHVPDKSSPVVFELHKIADTEPVYIFHVSSTVKTEGTRKWLDIAKGTLGENGDTAFTINYVESNASNGPGYSIRLESQLGAGLIQIEGENRSVAPEYDYLKSVLFFQKSDGVNIPTNSSSFFVRTSSNKYAQLFVEITLSSKKSAQVSATITYNPSGSRNLEFDPKKWLNP